MVGAEDLAATLRGLEEILLTPEGRGDPKVVRRLIAEDFVEFGSSGTVYRKPEIVRFLAEEAREAEPGAVTTADWEVSSLADQIALVTYRATRHAAGGGGTVSSLRSSIWRRTEAGWQMVFHQGTPLPPGHSST